MVEFSIGDKAVYPAQGVAEVVGIDNKEINNVVMSFYVLKVLDSEMQILVPKDKADQVGLRSVATSDEVEEVLEILGEQDVHIDKVVVHMSVGEAGDKLVKAENIITEITGQKPVRTIAKRTQPAFGIRKGQPIGCKGSYNWKICYLNTD